MINPHPPKGGCRLLQPPQTFQTAFLPNKLSQMLLRNHFYILYISFDVYKVKFGGVV